MSNLVHNYTHTHHEGGGEPGESSLALGGTATSATVPGKTAPARSSRTGVCAAASIARVCGSSSAPLRLTRSSQLSCRRHRPSRIVLLPAVRRDGTRLPRRLWHRVRGHRAQMDRFVLTDASHSCRRSLSL